MITNYALYGIKSDSSLEHETILINLQAGRKKTNKFLSDENKSAAYQNG